MILDFSLLLVVLLAVSGVIWAIDILFFKARRPAGVREPLPVEYARSFFPIILIVLLVRSFLIEPFRIPSDSMMPTLEDGDFIFVNKFSYGLRLPVLNLKLVRIGEPKRGDVIVFRKPSEPSVNYIKRLVGLPGDHIEVRDDAIWVNGQAMRSWGTGLYGEDSCYRNFRQGLEQLGEHEHRIMYCPGETHHYSHGCGKRDLNECLVDPALNLPPAGPNVDFSTTVPPGRYFFMGDNRDNSADSRFPDLGFVPEDNVVGKAVRIWLNIGNGSGPQWRRIGKAVQ
jgi:signal peptidase I